MNVTTSQPGKNAPSDKLCLLCAVLLLVPFSLNAQVVNDGATKTQANVTNTIAGNVTVGPNGSFTLLVLLTNLANGFIGLYASAKSNEVRLTSPTSRWLMGTDLGVGQDGASKPIPVS